MKHDGTPPLPPEKQQQEPPARRPYRSPNLYELGLLQTASGDRYTGMPEDTTYQPSG